MKNILLGLLALFVFIGCKKNKVKDDILQVECEDCRVIYKFDPNGPNINRGFFDIKGYGEVPYVKNENKIELSGFTRVPNGKVKIFYMKKVIFDGAMGEYPEWTEVNYSY